MHPIPILTLDGGLGTTLESPPYSVKFGPNTPLWSSHPLISDSSALTSVHRSFVEAGADVILSATYQGSFEGFVRTPRLVNGGAGGVTGANDRDGSEDRSKAVGKGATNGAAGYTRDEARGYMQSALGLAQDAFVSLKPPKKARVGLSLGPYGATMVPAQEYTGAYPAAMSSRHSLRDWHTERLGVFVDDRQTWEGYEWVAFETVRREDEVRAVRDVMAKLSEGAGGASEDLGEGGKKKWWLSGVYPEAEIAEDRVRDWIRAALDGEGQRPWGIGINCTGVGKIETIIEIMESEIDELEVRGRWRDEWEAERGRPWLVLCPDGAVGLKYDSTTMTWIETGQQKGARNWDEQLWEVVKAVRGRGKWEGMMIGGCCKTGPEEIRKLSHRMRADV